MKYFFVWVFILSIKIIQASILLSLKRNVLSKLDTSPVDVEASDVPTRRGSMTYFHHKKQEDAKDKRSAQSKASILKHARTHKNKLDIGQDMPSRSKETFDKRIGRHYFHMDPVFNELGGGRRSWNRKSLVSDRISSEMETKYWMDEWDHNWMQMKIDALNSTQSRGDVVNMVAARPWGVPCGDPNQHDMPWGNCMLQAECDPEYRIYRGDYFCGRTMFVCCSLLVTSYDMYQGLDISFEGSSFSSETDDKKSGSSAERGRQEKEEKRQRKKERLKRKRLIKKSIRRIVMEIRKILQKAYRNATAQRKKKTKELRKFVQLMKKQYRKDRKSVVNVHEQELVKIDEMLQQRLDKIKGMNEGFMTNDTFRDIIMKGLIHKKLRMMRSQPEFAKYFRAKHMSKGTLKRKKKRQEKNKEKKKGKKKEKKKEIKKENKKENQKENQREKKKEKKKEKQKEKQKEKRKRKKKGRRYLDYDFDYGLFYY